VASLELAGANNTGVLRCAQDDEDLREDFVCFFGFGIVAVLGFGVE
jgi:hypothetical protein